MRVGIFVPCFPVPSETFIVTKVLGLLDAGLDVHIFTLSPSRHWDRFEILAGRDDIRRRVHVIPPMRPLSKALTAGTYALICKALTHPTSFLRFVFHNWRLRHDLPFGFLKGVYLRQHFVGQTLDVLHVEFDMQGLTVVDLKDYLNCHILLSARGMFQQTSVGDRIPDAAPRLFRFVDGYHMISQYLLKNTHDLGLERSVPTWVIEPAIDVRLFEPKPRPPREAGPPLRIVSVGRLDWTKGYEFALDAVAKVRRAGMPVEYRVIGEGPYREAIEFAARQHGLLQDGTVQFEGAVPRERVVGYYEWADIMLHAALGEGFCNAVIEAQAMELPVVTSDANALPENVENGVTGLVVPRRDPDAMAAALLRLAGDPGLCRRLGQAGRVRVLAKFNLVHQVPRFVELYRELCRRPIRSFEDAPARPPIAVPTAR